MSSATAVMNIVRHPVFTTAVNFGVFAVTQFINAKKKSPFEVVDDDPEFIYEQRREISPWYIFFTYFIMLYALYVSYQLNHNPEIRKFLGFDGSASFLSTLVSFFFVFFLGPIVNLLIILTGIMETFAKYLAPTKLPEQKTWFDALAKAGEQDTLLKLFTILH